MIYHHKADPPLKGRAAMADIFDILGPIMVGPSSSHTAGAVRIGSMARTLLGERVVGADIRLHGSFAETGHGHGTDRALLAGLLGMGPADLRIPFAFEEAEKAGLSRILSDRKAAAKPAADAEAITAPPSEPVAASIGGIDVMDIEDAVRELWKAGIYAESGMGCTGPIVMISEANFERAEEILKKAGYIG